MKRKHIVIIGGGTGTYTLLTGLKKYPAEISVIVSTADDGGSTGRLRQELGVFPPGDIRQCLLGLSDADQVVKDLFAYRFTQGSLAGHTAGNILIAAAEKLHGGINQAIAAMAGFLQVRGTVMPATVKPAVLSAVYESGQRVTGEHAIDEPAKHPDSRIKKLQLKFYGAANPLAIAALKSADVIVFGPGDLYTSILPNIMVPEIKRAVALSKATKVYVTNLMTKHGQTDGFKASDFIAEMERYLGKGSLDSVIVNDQKPTRGWLDRYHKEHGEFVWPDISKIKTRGLRVSADNFLADYVFNNQPGDKLKRSLLRHNSDKLAAAVWKFTQ